MSNTNLNIRELNTIETSVETWHTYINESLDSDYFKNNLTKISNINDLAALTIFYQYLSIFDQDLQKKVLNDINLFKKFLKGFYTSLVPYKYSSKGYDKKIRAKFFSRIRVLLNQNKNENGTIKDVNRYIFTKTLLKFLSSEKFMLDIYTKYKTLNNL